MIRPLPPITPAEIRAWLQAYGDSGYAGFLVPLLPGYSAERVLGVRKPIVDRLATEVASRGGVHAFLEDLPHRYLEEDTLHATLLSRLRPANAVFRELERFLPYVETWAVCDSISPRVFRENPFILPPHISRWLGASHPYTVRFGFLMLLKHFAKERFELRYLEWATRVDLSHEYVSKGCAWFLAEALAFHPRTVIPFLEKGQLDTTTQLSAIQKALESRKVDKASKENLRHLRAEIRKKEKEGKS